MAPASAALPVGGAGANLSLEDVSQIACAGMEIVLDTAAEDRIRKDSPAPKNFAPEDDSSQEAPSTGASSSMDKPAVRATILFKLLSIMNGKSGARPAVARYLAELLNKDIVPKLATGDAGTEALQLLAAACKGQGETVGGEALAAALEAAGVQAPGLSSAERAALEGGQSPSGAVAGLVAHEADAALALATCVSALSCEALQASTASFAPDAAESQPAKGAVAAASELSGLLEGSRQVNVKKVGVGAAPFVVGLPQALGSARDSVDAVSKAAKVELGTTSLPPGKDGLSPLVPSPALAVSCAQLALALRSLISLASARVTAGVDRLPSVMAEGGDAAAAEALQQSLRGLLKGASEAAAGASSDAAAAFAAIGIAEGRLPDLKAALVAQRCLSALKQICALEALVSSVSLRLQEGDAPPPAEAAPAEEAPEGKKGKKGKKGKGGPAGMALGKGTAVLRSAVEARLLSGDAAAAVASLSLEDLKAAPSQGTPATWLESVCELFSSASLPPLLDTLKRVIESNQATRKPKIAKGTRDFMPDQMAIREQAFSKIVSVFKRHGAVAIDTPVFELRETLMGKYGEDSKLIYDLADQGGEILSLRYDLTVPFARYTALNGLGNIKRYHIARVYRRDQPQMSRGRFREFFQCDFDIAGKYGESSTMMPDAEVLKVLVEILSDLALGDFEVKLNHRGLLDTMMDIAGVPASKFRPICSAIDKLDKEPWEEVRREMVEDKGLPGDVADRIGEYVILKGKPLEMLTKLTDESCPLSSHPISKATLVDMKILFEYLGAMGALDNISFDLSLARGLDYYTGVIYEAVLKGGNVGSIAAGGRYDKLVGMFSGQDVPAVGVSIGIERVFAIMEAKMREAAAANNEKIRSNETQVLVSSIGNGMQAKRMEVASMLWSAGIAAEFGFKANPKMGDQIPYALDNGIPYMVVFGDAELEAGTVNLKDMKAETQESVELKGLVENLRARLGEGSGKRTVIG